MTPTKSTHPTTGKIPNKLPINDVIILGYVASNIGGITGKEIDDLIEIQGARNWTEIGTSSIYNCLKRLEQYKFIRTESIPKSRGRDPKMFYVTKEGLQIINKKINSILSGYNRTANPLDVGILNLPLLKKEEIVDSLENALHRLDEGIKFLQNYVDNLKSYFSIKNRDKIDLPNSPLSSVDPKQVTIITALFERPLMEVKARRKWMNNFLFQVKEGYVWCKDSDPILKNFNKHKGDT